MGGCRIGKKQKVTNEDYCESALRNPAYPIIDDHRRIFCSLDSERVRIFFSDSLDSLDFRFSPFFQGNPIPYNAQYCTNSYSCHKYSVFLSAIHLQHAHSRALSLSSQRSGMCVSKIECVL